MVVIAPGDAIEAEKATRAMAEDNRPGYLRLAREKTPIFSTKESPFEIGKAYILRDGRDITLMGTGTMTYQLLRAAHMLAQEGIEAEVLHVPTIKPLDGDAILTSLRKTGRALTAEEAQKDGGFGSAVAELLSAKLPMPLKRIGVKDRFGESGEPAELLREFGLTSETIVYKARAFVHSIPQYKQGF
jgi:transketolase